MTGRLRHRGPDATGARHFGECSLGHTRLRIIDLSPLGDQPLANEDGVVWAVFNGEIYNFIELRKELRAAGHNFRSETDTEVLVHLYEQHGDEMAHHLRGMFSFAVWDDRRRRLLLCRDRLGIKPLYYRIEGDVLSFASEVQGLTRAGDAVDLASVRRFLRLGWIPGPRTIRSGIRELPPGHLLVWDGRPAEPRPYPPSAVIEQERPPTSEELAEVLLDAMRRHLVADVPVGVFLSSGVDSAVVARLAAPLAPDLQTYTVAFESLTDESVQAAALADRLGLPNTVVSIGLSDAQESIGRFIGDMDQPTVDGLNSWIISRAVRSAGLVVALSGLGGDELFNGYSTFRHVPRLQRAQRVLGRLPIPSAVVHAMGWSDRTAHVRGRRAMEAIALGGTRDAYESVRGLFSEAELAEIWPTYGSHDGDPERPPSPESRRAGAVVGCLERENYLPFQLLRDTDCMSMAHALEIRVPLLDDEVVRVASRGQQLLPGWSKRHLIDAVDPDLQYLVRQPKKTFTLPIADWMHGGLRDTIGDAIVSLGEAGLGFDRRALTNLLSGYHAERVGWRPVWGLAVLGMWLDQHSSGNAA
jgi:asparagine synthase (glutamine-hydrolysing)